jgi:MFS-type transporter involved in bile tolerance (Atg22 family)
MVHLSPRERLGEFYGLYATVGRFASILGPLTWALVVDVLGWGRRAAMGALAVFIFLGWLNLRQVNEPVSTTATVGEVSSG